MARGVSGKDEVAALADSFNRMAERIGELLLRPQDAPANASHELRSPLARLRNGCRDAATAGDKSSSRSSKSNIAELDVLSVRFFWPAASKRLDIATEMRPVDLLAITAEECAAADVSLEGSSSWS